MGGKVISNLDQLAEGIGSYIGMMEGLETQTYMSSLLDRTFPDVSEQFNQHAVGIAMADPLSYGHMWEFGTRGITRGAARRSPFNPESRLWNNVILGDGKNRTIAFTFKKAKGFTPGYTEEETGVDQHILDSLKVNSGRKKYRFPNKAYIFESGMDINVLPKQAKRLFVPIELEGIPSGWDGNEIEAEEKGYVWAKSQAYSPGDFAGATGNFTAAFGAWWLGPGARLMFESMARTVEDDLQTVAATIKVSKGMKPTQAFNLQSAVKRGKSKTKKQFTLKVRQEMNRRAEVLL